jgi:hypothetical protein
MVIASINSSNINRFDNFCPLKVSQLQKKILLLFLHQNKLLYFLFAKCFSLASLEQGTFLMKIIALLRG